MENSETGSAPIDGGLHSEYELAIMHRQSLWLTWRDTQGTIHSGTYRPPDLRTMQVEEFMVVTDAESQGSHIRPDYIMSYNPA